MRKYLTYVIVGACLGGVIAPGAFIVSSIARPRSEFFYIVFYPINKGFELIVRLFNFSSGGEILLPLFIPAAIVYGIIIGAILGLIVYFVMKIQKKFEEEEPKIT